MKGMRLCVSVHVQAEMHARDKEAEMNAAMMKLHSRIHWMTEENNQLHQTQAAAAGGEAAAAGGWPCSWPC